MNRSSKYSNEELIRGIRNKDNLVLQYIVDKNITTVRRYVLSHHGHEEDAKDVLQEAIIILFRKVNEVNFKLTSKLETFLYSIAKLLWLRELEYRNKTLMDDSFDVIDDSDNINSIIEKNDRLKLYREKFEELGDDCKKVLRLFHLGTPLKQITQFMGYSSDKYTKQKKYKCKNALVATIKGSKHFKELANER